MWTVFAVFLIGAYLLGSVPFGLLISQKVARLDITKAGSGNIGATNVAREVGLRWGVITLLADVVKGFIPVVLARHFLGSSIEINEALIGMVGLSALLGHQFPLYNRFRGGKGVATCLGVLSAVSPISCLFSGVVFFVLVALWRYVSLGSILGALTMPIWLYVTGHSTFMILSSLVMSLLITFQHRENIQRLVQGNERRWQKAKLH